MIRPTHDESELAHITGLDYESLRQDFRNALESFIGHLYKYPEPKTLNQRPISGQMLMGLLSDYVEAINSDENIIVMNTLSRVVYQEATKFIDNLFEEMSNEIATSIKLPIDSHLLYSKSNSMRMKGI